MAGGQHLIEANINKMAGRMGRQNGDGVNPPRPQRKKRSATGSLNGNNDFLAEGFNHQYHQSTTESKKKSHKTRRAPPIPVIGSVSDGKCN